jgi:hypothetical protein
MNATAGVRTEMARRLQAQLRAYGLRGVFWEEALHYGIDDAASIVAPWFSAGAAAEAASLGHQVRGPLRRTRIAVHRHAPSAHNGLLPRLARTA